MEEIARGSHGVLYETTYEGRRAVVKREHPEIDAGVVQREARGLRAANEFGIGPELFAETDDAVYMEYIAGTLLEDWCGELGPVLRSVLDTLRRLDREGLDKGENTRPHRHVIINDGITLIDFERCRHSPEPQNVTQFTQYCLQHQDELSNEGIDMDRAEVIEHARQYKQSYGEHDFRELLGCLGLSSVQSIA